MSVQADIERFLGTLADGTKEKQVDITPDQIAVQTGISRDKVNKTLNNLMTRKRIDLMRGPNGRTITGYRLLEPPPDRRRRDGGHVLRPVSVEERDMLRRGEASRPPTPHRVRRAYTPMLDEYWSKKEQFNQMVSVLGDRVEATFREDPVAEEALLLKERLELAESSLSEWRHRAEDAEREVRDLRTRHIQAVTRKTMESGAVVVHSDPND